MLLLTRLSARIFRTSPKRDTNQAFFPFHSRTGATGRSSRICSYAGGGENGHARAIGKAGSWSSEAEGRYVKVIFHAPSCVDVPRLARLSTYGRCPTLSTYGSVPDHGCLIIRHYT